MKKNIRLALVGVGKWGKNYIRTIENIENIQLKIIGCQNLKNKDDIIHKYEVTDNWNDVTKCSEINGVIVSTPPNTHFEIASEAIKNKKHVLIEKPVTLQSKEVKELIDLSIKNNVSVKVNHIYLYHPLYRFLKKHIRNKSKIRSVYSLSGNFGPFRKDVSPLWDWAPHDLSMCLDLIGEMPNSIDATYSKKNPGNFENNIKVRLGFRNSKFAELNFGNLMVNKTRLFKVNFDSINFIFDPINYRTIMEEKNSLIRKVQQNPNFHTNVAEKPLEILVKEFVKNIPSNPIDIKDLKLAENVLILIEKIEKKLL